MGVTFEKSEYRGYEALVFEIDTRKVILVRPNKEMGHRRLVMKTEYFDAFPDLQIEMLERGYHLTCVENRSRWGTDEDCRTKAEVVRFLHEHFSLYPRVITVGMSCGGFPSCSPSSISMRRCFPSSPILTAWVRLQEMSRSLRRSRGLTALIFPTRLPITVSPFTVCKPSPTHACPSPWSTAMPIKGFPAVKTP